MEIFLLTRRAGKNNEFEVRGYLFEYLRVVLVAFALTILGVVASSCETKTVNLEERVKAYWEARTKGQAELAFEFEAPGSIDKPTYLKKILTAPVAFTSCTIQSIKENGNEAEVVLRAEYLLPGLSRPVSSSMMERWVRINGQWYHDLPVGSDGGTDTERG
ncbi:MAG: hypothetical protein AB7P18_20330 [Candidatus Binatia bacterium]